MNGGRIGYAVVETAKDMTVRPYKYVADEINCSDAKPTAKVLAIGTAHIGIALGEAFLGIRSFGVLPAAVALGRVYSNYRDYSIE